MNQQQQQKQCRCYKCGQVTSADNQYNYEHFEPFFCNDDCRLAFHLVMAAPLFDDDQVLMAMDKLKVPGKVKRRIKKARRAAVHTARKAAREARKAAHAAGGGGGGRPNNTNDDIISDASGDYSSRAESSTESGQYR